MNKEIIYSSLRHLCSQSCCDTCLVSSINFEHKCGRGYGYLLSVHPVPLPETLKYYAIIFGEENLRAAIEKRKENDRYERRV